MRRNKQAYNNFVCPKCFRQLNKCTCPYFPPWTLIFIDEHIQDQVRILNEKGYVTTGCCEAHFDMPGSWTHVCLQENYPEIVEHLPVNYKYMKGKHAIYFAYPQGLTEEEHAAMKEKALSVLLDWCKGLPAREAMR